MATRLQFRKFSTTSIATLVGANGELYVDTTKKTIVVQDGATTGGSTLATESWVSSALGTVSFNTSVLNGYALSSTLTSYTTNANLTSTLVGYALSSVLTSYTTNANLTSTLANYTTNANLTSTLANYTTNANLTSTLAAYTFNTSVLTSYTTNANLTSTLTAYPTNANLTSTLASYTTNTNLTSTLAGYALSSALTSYTTNANLTSTLAQYALSSTLTSYTTNANLTSTLTNYTTNANLTSTLANYTTNANLTSTLATYVPTTSLLSVTTLTANTITVTNTSNATTTANGALILYGGLSVNRDIFLAGTSTLKIGTGTMSISQDGITRANGAMTLRAGGGGSNLASMLFTNNTGVQIWGGSAVANQPSFSAYGIRLANRDGNVSVSDSSDSTSISTGSFVVTGGVGISKRLNVGGQALVSSLSVSNNAIISGFLTLPNRPAFRVIGNSSTNHTETSNGIGILTGNNYTVDYNQGSYLNTSTGVFTAPISGLYHITLNAKTSSFNNAMSQLICYDNYSSTATVALMWESTASGTATHFGVSTIASLTSGDALVIKVGAGTINFDGNDSWAVAFIG